MTDLIARGAWVPYPMNAYLLTAAIANDSKDTADRLWEALTHDDRACLTISLGAQALRAALDAQFKLCRPVPVPAGIWDRVVCAKVLKMVRDAYAGATVRVPRRLCGPCLRAAADTLAELCIIELEAAGISRGEVAAICIQNAAPGPLRSRQPSVPRSAVDHSLTRRRFVRFIRHRRPRASRMSG